MWKNKWYKKVKGKVFIDWRNPSEEEIRELKSGGFKIKKIYKIGSIKGVDVCMIRKGAEGGNLSQNVTIFSILDSSSCKYGLGEQEFNTNGFGVVFKDTLNAMKSASVDYSENLLEVRKYMIKKGY